MLERLARIAAIAESHHGAVSLDQLRAIDVPPSTVTRWCRNGVLRRLGSRSFAWSGAPDTWEMHLAAGLADLHGHGVIAGRSAARLWDLDGFDGDELEFLVARSARRASAPTRRVASAAWTPPPSEIGVRSGLRCLRPEATIATAPRFGFTRREIENAIDSAVRMRLVAEQRLRTRVIADHSRGINHSRPLLDALVDSGGESRLERWFLRAVARAGLPRPAVQCTFRDGTRVVARVDALFPGGLVVELAGHGTHATRRQRQVDAQRHTELTLRRMRVLTFTYDDVRYRPDWVVARLREALSMAAA